jgi:hypothetical protein
MRIQEHIYQGFFGLKKKQDAGKYYHERIGKLKGVDTELDKVIEEFQKVLVNHNNKIKNYYEFLKKPGKDTFKGVRQEIEKLEGMFDQDEMANDTEQRCCLKGIDTLKELTKSEDSTELGQLEQDTIADLNELMHMLKSVEPLWQKQIDFIKKSDEEILASKENIQILSDVLKEEDDVLKMEESLLRKVDLKTGALLRKTTLKERDIDRTSDMDMLYRDIKHVR